MKLSVLHLTNNLKSGAIPHTIIELSPHLSKEFNIFAGGLLAGSDARVNEEVINELEEVGVTPLRFQFDVKPFYKAIRELYNSLECIDILHTHLVRSGIFGRVLGNIAGTPCIVSTEQSVHTADQYNKKQRFLNSVTLPLADYVVPISSAVEKSFNWWVKSTIPSNRRRIIHNPVDGKKIQSYREGSIASPIRPFISQSSPIVGSVGRLAPVKNHELLLDAVAPLTDQYPDLGVVLVGDGPLEATLREQVQQLGIEDSVLFTGRIERSMVYTLLHEFDVFGMPSLHEGQGIALCEAMCAGTPIVASDIPVFRDILGDSGRLVDFHAEDWSSELRQAISENDVREDLQVRAQEKFSPQKTAALYEEIYKNSLRNSD
ncbi:glycosyltransferase family 4 protein [Halorussus marinus]|uniref:glycosyltransferase family 4 protein n=1 Tax=Halorussus marinus TaxID=2505976 RepID=UPI00109296A4|nr:glycosyltransferase family 4 protein [Halorussus marinus]